MSAETDFDERTERDCELLAEASRVGALPELSACFLDVRRIKSGVRGNFDDVVYLAFLLRGLDELYQEWWDRKNGPERLIAALKEYGPALCAPPRSVYKYRSLATPEGREHAYRMVVTGEIYLASPMHLNDPFDCLPAISTVSSTGADLATQLGTTMEDLAGAYRAASRMALGICSLSADPANAVMWAHYADNGRGIAVEFDAYATYMFALERHRQGFRFRPVSYVETLTPIQLDRSEAMSESINASVWQKTRDWTYEQEWRLLVELHGPALGLDSSSRITSYSGFVTGVVAGHRATPETVALVAEWCRSGGLPLPRQLRIDPYAGKLTLE